MKKENMFDEKTELSNTNKRIGLGVGKLGNIDWDAFDAMDKEISDMFEGPCSSQNCQ